MSVLSDKTIRKFCGVDGMVRRRDNLLLDIQPVSIDLHLDEIYLYGKKRQTATLRPGIFCLGSVIETFNMPDYVVGMVVGKSTNAREGLQIEAAGLIDPGFKGDITLELKNLHHEFDYRLTRGEPIGQVYFMYTDQPVEVPYGLENGNHYQGQRGVTPSYRQSRIF